MLLSIFLSFLLARKLGARIYVLLVTIKIILVSLLSLSFPLSFPFYSYIYAAVGPGSPGPVYELYFLTLEIHRSMETNGMLFLYYSFFLLVNIVGAVIGYWMSKSKKLTGIFQDEV